MFVVLGVRRESMLIGFCVAIDLGNMGVRASMSVVSWLRAFACWLSEANVYRLFGQSIIAFGTLWGLVACHSYGPHGMRVSFPVRQMLRLLSQSISRNIERLSYAQRLHTRKLVSTFPTCASRQTYQLTRLITF